MMTQQEYDILAYYYYIFALCAFWASRLTDVLYNKRPHPVIKFPTWTHVRSGSLVLRIHTHTFSGGAVPLDYTVRPTTHGIQ